MNPHTNTQHIAVMREAQLAAGLIGSGATSLGKANYAQIAHYHHAFFGLSIGIERLCKLLIVADHAICNNGQIPKHKIIRDFGHDLVRLFDACESIGARVSQTRAYKDRPSSAVHQGIISVLTEFAGFGRYYNIDFLTSTSTRGGDPVADWWLKVGEPICNKHYTERMRRRDQWQSQVAEAMYGDIAMVWHTSETGDHIGSIGQGMMQTRRNLVAQRYGRLYTLQLVRWLVSISFELSHIAGYKLGIQALFCFHEAFTIFYNDDELLRSRKTWGPYP